MDTLSSPPRATAPPLPVRPLRTGAVLLPAEPDAESTDDPDSPGSHHSLPAVPPPHPDPIDLPLAFLAGSLIALLTVLVPLATVVVDRRADPGTGAVPSRLPPGQAPSLSP